MEKELKMQNILTIYKLAAEKKLTLDRLLTKKIIDKINEYIKSI